MTRRMEAALGFFVGALSAMAEPPKVPPFREAVTVSALQIVIRTTRVETLKTRDLEIWVDGKMANVLSVRPLIHQTRVEKLGSGAGKAEETERMLGGKTPVQIILLPELCDPRTLALAARELRKLTLFLDSLGPISAIVASNPPRVLGPPANTPAELEALLSDLGRVRTVNWVARLRREEKDLQVSVWGKSPERQLAQMELLSRARTAEEIIRISTALNNLMGSVNSFARPGSLVLILADGFDVDLNLQLRPPLAKDESKPREAAAVDFSPGLSLQLRLQKIGQWAAAQGIVLLPVFAGFGGYFAPRWAAEHRKVPITEEVFSGHLDPGLLVERPREPLVILADESGGTVLNVGEGLEQGMGRMADAWVVEFQVPFPCDRERLPLQVRSSREGVEVTAPSEVLCRGSATQALLIALYGWEHRGWEFGRFSVTAELEKASPSEKRLIVASDLSTLLGGQRTLTTLTMRVTVAVHMARGEPFVHQEEFELGVDEGREGTVWTYEAPMKLPKEAERLAVVVEELHTGAWGAAVVDVQGQAKR